MLFSSWQSQLVDFSWFIRGGYIPLVRISVLCFSVFSYSMLATRYLNRIRRWIKSQVSSQLSQILLFCGMCDLRRYECKPVWTKMIKTIFCAHMKYNMLLRNCTITFPGFSEWFDTIEHARDCYQWYNMTPNIPVKITGLSETFSQSPKFLIMQ